MDKLNNMDALYKLSKDIIATDMFTEFSEIKDNGAVSDFQIKVENEVFNVHRFILIAASPYFKALFKSNMREVEQKFIEMEGLDADGIKYCLQFIYTRDIDLSTAPIESILPASHLLQINALTDLCFGYLRLNISKDNCISTLKVAQLYQNNVAMNTAEQYIQRHFASLAQMEDIGDLDEKEIDQLLESQNSYFEEKAKFIAAVNWTRTKPRHRKKHFPKLFKLIKLEKLSSVYIKQKVRSESLVKESPECLNHILVCSERDKTPVPHIACLYRGSDVIKIFNPSSNQWSHLVKVPKFYPPKKEQSFFNFPLLRGPLNIVSVDNMLYLLDDKDLLVLQEDGTWLKKTTMPRHPDCVASFQDRIYCIDDATMSCYDPNQNTWDTNLPGCGLGLDWCVASSDEFIYAIGDEARKFDPNTRTWLNITSMNIKQYATSTAVLNGKVFVMGGWGFDDDEYFYGVGYIYEKPLHDVEFYDPTQQRWYDVAGLCHPRRDFSSCAINNKLYAVGGADSIEVYNQELNKWEVVCEMRELQYTKQCCVIKL